MSDDVGRSRVDVRFSDADVSRVEQSLANHIVATFEAVCLAVGTELAERQCFRRRRDVHHSLADDVVVAVVVVEWAPVVGRRLPRLTRGWLTDDVIAEPLKTQLQIRDVHGNEEDCDHMVPWDSHGIPMRMGIRSAMGWEWDGNGNEVHGNGN